MTKLTHSGAEFMSELLGCHSNFKDDISSELHPSKYHAAWQNELVEEFGEDVTSIDQSRHYAIEVPDRIDGYGRLIQGDGDYIVKLRGSQDQDKAVINQAVREPRVAAEAHLRGDSDMFAEIIGVESNYKWVVMEQVEPRDLDRDRRTEMRSEYRDKGWVPKDSEFGRTDDGRTVCYDYGLFDRPEWEVQKEDLPYEDAFPLFSL
jgi:hypothetical protein